MTKLNYILQGFGFRDSHDFLRSAFGHTFSMLFIKMDVILSLLFATIHFLFGFNHLFLTAYAVLLIFEWITGVQASRKRGEKHESRKFGRMLLKIATYLVPIYILHTFSANVDFPSIGGFEFDPFHWLYWVVLIGIIWQLVVSLLENLDCLGFRFAKVLLKIINKKFYKTFELEEPHGQLNNQDNGDNSPT